MDNLKIDGQHVFPKTEFEFCLIFETNFIVFEGLWKNDEFIYGVKYEDNNQYYKGFFKSFQFHGFGSFYDWEGSVIEGQWRENQIQGFVKVQHINGSRFEGNWNFETGCGKGKYFWADGDTYEGEYKNFVRR